MGKKTLVSLVVTVAVVGVVAVALLVGFYEEKVPFTQSYEERELVKQWLQMYGEYDYTVDEDDLDEFVNVFKTAGVHPVEIYRGSMIFYEESYGYIYMPDLDDDFRTMPQDMTEKEFVDLVREKGGTVTSIPFLPGGDFCACFPTLGEAENFLAEFWSLEVTTHFHE